MHNNVVFWDVIPCSLLWWFQYFRKYQCLHPDT